MSTSGEILFFTSSGYKPVLGNLAFIHVSSDVLDICVPVVSTLTSSPQFVQNTVELLVDMVVKNLAAASINKTKFHEPGKERIGLT